MLSMYSSSAGLPFYKTLFSTLVLAASLTACNDNDTPTAENKGAFQLINSMSDSPYLELKITQNGDTVKRYTNMRYGHATPALLLDEGHYDISLNYFNPDTDESATLAEEQNVLVTEGYYKTLLLTGPFSDADIEESEKPLTIFIDDHADDTIELQALNNSDLALDIYVSSPDDALNDATKWQDLDADSLSAASLEDHIDDTDYRIRITEDNSDTVLFDSGTLTINDRSRNMLVINPDGDSLDVVYANHNGALTLDNHTVDAQISTFNLYPLHTTTTTTLRDAEDDSLIINWQVTFGDESDSVASGASFIDATVIDPSAQHNNAENVFPLQQDHTYTHVVALQQDIDDNSTDLISKLIINPILPQATSASVQFINALGQTDQNDDPRVDLYVLNIGDTLATANPVAIDIGFLSGYAFSLVEDSYDLVVTERDSDTVLAGPTRIDVDSNTTVLIGLSEGLNGGTPNQLSIQERDLNPQ